MKIIKRIKPKKSVGRLTCGACGTVFEFDKYEAMQVNSIQEKDEYSVRCPTCKLVINFNKSVFKDK